MFFLDVQIIREDETFTNSVYREPTFTGVRTHFESFLPLITLLVKQISLKHNYSENFINKCFKTIMDNIHVVKETTLTVKKKPLVLGLLYLHQYPYRLGLS